MRLKLGSPRRPATAPTDDSQAASTTIASRDPRNLLQNDESPSNPKASSAPKDSPQALVTTATAMATAKGPSDPQAILRLRGLHSDSSASRASFQRQESRARSLKQPVYPVAEAAALYGNKAAHLMALEASFNDPHVRVPAFFPVAHTDMVAALLEVGVDVSASWQSFRAAQGDARSLTPEACQILSTLRKAIESGLTMNSTALTTLSKWVAARPGTRLVVRSTGREDSEKVPNAGGNDSVSSLPPDVAKVVAAVGQVVASYFGEKSLQQRLDANDDILAEPFLPVFVQVMVGEHMMRGIPVAGAMHTLETRGPTPSVSEINSSFGHAAGVLGGLVVTDTAYVQRGAGVHFVNSVKDRRLVGTPDGSRTQFHYVDNGSKAIQPSLSEELAERLGNLGQTIAAFFGTPVNVEWTYDPAAKVIYLLQAATRKRSTSGDATHLQINGLQDCETEHAAVISAAGCQVRMLTRGEQVICTATLPEALKQYLARAERSLVRAIIVRLPAPPTSHEATTLHAAGIAVLHADATSVTDWLSSKIPVAVDTQRGLLVALRSFSARLTGLSENEALAVLKDQGVVGTGLVQHPIPVRQSIAQQVTQDQQREVALFLCDLLNTLRLCRANVKHWQAILNKPDANHEAAIADIIEALVTLDTSAAPTNMRPKSGQRPLQFWLTHAQEPEKSTYVKRWFTRIGAPDQKTRAWALTLLLRCALRVGARASRDPLQRQDARLVLWQLLRDARAVYLAQGHGASAIEQLYAFVWLRADLEQTHDAQVVGALSVRTMAEEMIRVKRRGHLVVSDPETQAYIDSLMSASNIALNSHIAAAWKQFVTELAQDPREPWAFPALASLQKTLLRQQALGDWLNTSFWRAWSADGRGDAVKCLVSLGSAFSNTDNLRAFDLARNVRQFTDAWRGRVDEWGDPAQFDKLWLQMEPNTKVFSKGVAAAFDTAGDLGKILILRAVGDFVDVYDRSIKSLVGSQAYTMQPALKATRWFSMLRPYAAVAQAWLRRCSSSVEKPAQYSRMIAWGVNSLEERLKAREELAALLDPADVFNVSGNVLGSGVSVYVRTITTLEGLFTTVHQNCLAALSRLNGAHGISESDLPPVLRAVCGHIQALTHPMEDDGPAIRPLSLSYNHPELQVSYTIPLRHHGLQLQLHAELGEDAEVRRLRWIFECNGPNESMHRMDRITAYAALISHALGLRFSDGAAPRYDGSTLRFAWDIEAKMLAEPQREVAQLVVHIQNMMEMTFTYAFDNFSEGLSESALEDIVTLASRAIPDFSRHLHTLPTAFFETYPFFNAEFLSFFKDPVERDRVARASLAAPAGLSAYWNASTFSASALLDRPLASYFDAENAIRAACRLQMKNHASTAREIVAWVNKQAGPTTLARAFAAVPREPALSDAADLLYADFTGPVHAGATRTGWLSRS